MAVLAFAALVAQLLVEPSALLAGLASCVLAAFWIARRPAQLLLAIVPFAAIANLEPWMPDPGAAYPSEAMLLAAIGVVAVRRPRVFHFSGTARIALAYGVWIALAAIVATATADEASWSDAARLLRSGFLAASVATLGSTLARAEDGAALWSRAALGAAGLLGAIAIGEAMCGQHAGVPQTGRVVGGSELLALHLTLLLPPGLVLAAGAGRRFRAAAISLLALAATGLVLSYSRSGWVGGMVSVAGMAMFTFASHGEPSRRLRLLTAAALVVGVSVVTALAIGSGDGELARAYADRLRSLTGPHVFADRAGAWSIGVEAVRAHPWFGWPGAPNPYNLALDLAATSGVPALLLFGWFAASSLAGGIRVAVRGDTRAPLALGLCGAVVALLVTGIGESTLGARMTPAVFASLGVLAGIGEREATPAR